MNLYQVTGEILELQMMAESGDYDAQTIADTMEAIEGDFEDKAEAYQKVMTNIKADIAALDAEIKRMTDKKKALTNTVDSMSDRLKESMISTGKIKFKTSLWSFSVGKAGGKAPLILDCDVEELPLDMVKLKTEPDSEAIRAYLDNGGTEFAHYGERKDVLRIK